MRCAVAAVAVAALLAGCGGDDARPGTLTVDERWTDGPYFIEGHVAFASVHDAAGRQVAKDRRPPAVEKPPILTRRLDPGRYRVEGYVRSCGGSCGAYLDHATDHCSATVSIDGDTRVTFVRSDRTGCYVEVVEP